MQYDLHGEYTWEVKVVVIQPSHFGQYDQENFQTCPSLCHASKPFLTKCLSSDAATHVCPALLVFTGHSFVFD